MVIATVVLQAFLMSLLSGTFDCNFALREWHVSYSAARVETGTNHPTIDVAKGRRALVSSSATRPRGGLGGNHLTTFTFNGFNRTLSCGTLDACFVIFTAGTLFTNISGAATTSVARTGVAAFRNFTF